MLNVESRKRKTGAMIKVVLLLFYEQTMFQKEFLSQPL
jgi:hypothetical protein